MNRIKTLAIALGAMLTVCTAQAQSIVKQDATMEDFFQLIKRADVAQQAEVEGQGDNIQRLNHAGFKLFAFDISPMEMDKYGFRPAIMKYENGKTEDLLQDMWMGSFYRVPSRYTRCVVGVSPLNESTVRGYINLSGLGRGHNMPFKMVHGSYHIVATPFVLPKEVKWNEFIPLMVVSSGWYDDENECVRNSDVDEFDESNYLETETFKNSPLIYVIGMKISKLMTVGTAQAQNLVKQDVTMNDYFELLSRTGFRPYAFDISSMETNKYGFTPVIMKYEDGKTENMLQDLEDEGCIFTNDIPRFTVGLSPKNDTTFQCHIYWGDKGVSHLMPFKKVCGEQPVMDSRAFVQPKKLKLNEFIPLLAVASGWYDERVQHNRSCGPYQFKSKNYLKTDIFKKSPLIYVIGVKCKEL